MKMGLNNFSANEVVNNLNNQELEKIFKYFGDENDAKKISQNIVMERKKEINTQDLVKIIEKSKRKNAIKFTQLLKRFKL